MSSGEPYPQLIAFDLDYTLWLVCLLPKRIFADVNLCDRPLWVDTHVNPPLKRQGDDVNRVFDASGQAMSFYPEVSDIFSDIRLQKDTTVAACSRTHAPPAYMSEVYTGLQKLTLTVITVQSRLSKDCSFPSDLQRPGPPN